MNVGAIGRSFLQSCDKKLEILSKRSKNTKSWIYARKTKHSKKPKGKFPFFWAIKKTKVFGEKKRKTLLRLPALQNSNTTRNFLQSALLGALLLAPISVPFCSSTCRSSASLELAPPPPRLPHPLLICLCKSMTWTYPYLRVFILMLALFLEFVHVLWFAFCPPGFESGGFFFPPSRFFACFCVCPQFCAAAYDVAMRLNWEFGSFCLPLFLGAMYFLQFLLLMVFLDVL